MLRLLAIVFHGPYLIWEAWRSLPRPRIDKASIGHCDICGEACTGTRCKDCTYDVMGG